jgi:fatty-acyl-CoA synthase
MDPEPPEAPTHDPRVPDPLHNSGSWIPRWAAQNGDAPALVFGDRRLCYRELDDRVARLAGVMRKAGVGPGDRVALFLENRPAFLEAVFASARIGAIVLPINTRLTPDEIRFILADASPRLLIEESSAAATLDGACAGLAHVLKRLDIGPSEDEYESILADAPPVRGVTPALPDDPMILMYTSGTTGTPKGALLPHRKALHNSINAQGCFGIRPTDRILVVAPLFHSLGLQILSLPVFYAGGCVVLQSGFDAERILHCIERESIHFMGGVPTYFERIHPHLDPCERDLSSLRFLFTAGSAVAPELVTAYGEKGLDLMQGYGQTETSLLCCLDAAHVARKAGSVGRALEHVELRVVTRDTIEGPPAQWRDVTGDAIGEIVARGPIAMLGYWQRPEETARTLREGWVLTGDLARIDSQGFVTLTGRSREMFISGGENVYPAEIERVFSEHPDIGEIAVVAEPDPDWGEIGVAYVVWADGRPKADGAMHEWARQRLAGFKIPRRFVTLDALPRTASGKVRKHLLAVQQTEESRAGSARAPS